MISGSDQKYDLLHEQDNNSASLASVSVNNDSSITTNHYKQYKRRWFMLFLFCSYTLSNGYQWIHLNIIADRVSQYWNASLPSSDYMRKLSIDLLSISYLIVYVVLILPAAWFLEKYGMRSTAIMATVLNAIGACVRCGALSSNRYWVLLTSQFFCAFAQLFSLSIPPVLSAVWFGVDEVATATAIGVFGNQVGMALGCAIPGIVVPITLDLVAVGDGFSYLFYSVAAINVVIFLLVLLFMQEKPPSPPTASQLDSESSKQDYQQSLKQLATNKGFVLHTISFAINMGGICSLSTLLNAIMLTFFKEHGNLIGWVGFTMLIAGLPGSIIAGIVLDATKQYKLLTFVVYLFSTILMGFFTGMLYWKLLSLSFITSFLIGFFATGYWPLGYEFAAELTYPINEGLSSGILNAVGQAVGVVFILINSYSIETWGILSANCTLTAAFAIGLVLTAIIPADLRRSSTYHETAKAMKNEINNESDIKQE